MSGWDDTSKLTAVAAVAMALTYFFTSEAVDAKWQHRFVAAQCMSKHAAADEADTEEMTNGQPTNPGGQ